MPAKTKPFRRIIIGFLLALLVGTTLVAFSSQGRANLTIMPVRVVFNDRDRNVDMTIANPSSSTANTYRLELTYRKMAENGTYEKLTAPLSPALDFSKALVFTPRQVTIQPQGRQSIRLSLRRPADLPEGEYRAHLVFRKLPDPPRNTKGPQDGVGAKISVNLGFSVPVIVRVGAYDGQATISDIKLGPPTTPDEGGRINLSLNRTGKHSITGRVLVLWTPPGGQEEQIGILNNLNIFTEIDRRNISISLTNKTPITGGTLRVIYEGIDDERGVKFDEKILPIQ